MKYPRITKATFVDRPNRFIARVIVDGTQVDVHVKNTGRCKELLVPGATVFLEDFEGRMGTRKHRWSLWKNQQKREFFLSTWTVRHRIRLWKKHLKKAD